MEPNPSTSVSVVGGRVYLHSDASTPTISNECPPQTLTAKKCNLNRLTHIKLYAGLLRNNRFFF